jgi:drug/metabolite transporter (DMT)-like permease
MPAAFLVVWSGGFAFAKIALQHSGPLTLLAVRYALVVLLLAPVVLLLRPPIPDRRKTWAHMIVLGILVQVLYFGLTMIALDLKMSAGAVAVIVSLQPILVAILAGPVLAERVSPLQWVGLLLALAGALLVILPRTSLRTSPLGVAAAVGALLAIAVATVYERRLQTTGEFLATNAVQYVVGAAVLVPAALVFEGLRFDLAPAFVIAIGYLALGNSLLSLTLLFAMIRAGEAARVSAMFFLVPPVSALIALVLLHEQLPLLAWAGMAVAGTGVAIATLSNAGGRETA